MALELFKNNQPNSKRVKATSSDDKEAKVKAIIERAIVKAENSPKRSSEEIWEEFEAVWNKIASQA
jgi:hypothetical protein